MDPSQTADELSLRPDSVCTACGCLCDDIELHVEGDRIVEARHACALGEAHFLGTRDADGDGPRILGEPTSLDAAVDRAAAILSDASCPLIVGLQECTTEGQRAAVGLAEAIGGCLDVAGSSATIRALRSVGEVTCTLGEIRNRSDVLLVWRADPVSTHPRLFSRYVLDPEGEFLPGGRRDRFLAAVDVRETSTLAVADHAIRIEEGNDVDAIWTLRALARGIAIEAEEAAGIPLDLWRGLLGRIQGARYAAILYDAGADDLAVLGLHALVRELNETTRCVAMPLGPGGNAVGARNVLAWRTGSPIGARFAGGQWAVEPDDFEAARLVRERSVDAVLVVSGKPIDEADEGVVAVPRIVLTERGATRFPGVDVVIQTARFGIETSGTVYRMDGVPLPLRAAVTSRFPAVEDVLRAIERRVRERRA